MQANPALKGVQGLVLVPTRELCEQVRDHMRMLTFYCARLINILMLTADVPMETQRYVSSLVNTPLVCAARPFLIACPSPNTPYRTQLAQLPDILISTPARLLAHLDAKVRAWTGAQGGQREECRRREESERIGARVDSDSERNEEGGKKASGSGRVWTV